jgi:hypothetical protein
MPYGVNVHAGMVVAKTGPFSRAKGSQGHFRRTQTHRGGVFDRQALRPGEAGRLSRA